jgi:hypothetical protein
MFSCDSYLAVFSCINFSFYTPLCSPFVILTRTPALVYSVSWSAYTVFQMRSFRFCISVRWLSFNHCAYIFFVDNCQRKGHFVLPFSFIKSFGRDNFIAWRWHQMFSFLSFRVLHSMLQPCGRNELKNASSLLLTELNIDGYIIFLYT